MSVLTIRTYRRYATRLPVGLRRAGRKSVRGLLIELSQQGARISNIEGGTLEPGDPVVLAAQSGARLSGTIRWAHDNVAGVRLDQPLHLPELRELLDLSRREQSASEPRYGT
ncbi:MAG: PilZ domain-containing protein [Erythrobacter sp.]|nr:PilZ domain-containing protein [Erythrobacter sp.]